MVPVLRQWIVLGALLPIGIARATAPPVCDGSVFPCRPCTASDDGQPGGCQAPRPICETAETNPRFGNCVACTADLQCPAGMPVCVAAGPSTDTCRACTSDADCVVNPAGHSCLGSGPCGDPSEMQSCASVSGGGGAVGAGFLPLLAFLLLVRARR